MKKQIILILLAVVGLLVGSCGNTKSPEKNTVQTSAATIVWSCPMHPDVTGKEGDVCSKCGMKLEPHERGTAQDNLEYYMKFSEPEVPVKPGQKVKIAMTPAIKGQDGKAVPLELQHEKKIHLIVVNEDLSWFDHIHPEYNADGSYSVEESFPKPGHYFLYADYKPSGGGPQLARQELMVEGAAPKPVTFSKAILKSSSGDYGFELRPTGGKFISGTTMHIEGIVSKDGTKLDANTLPDYLGAKAHVVVISLSDHTYQHVHPQISNAQFDLHASFEKPGIYRCWVQFNGLDNQLHTMDFVIPVAAGTPEDVEKMNEAHGAYHQQQAAAAHTH
ncbi:MAG: hypothetical protein JST06_10705 [Bacteroidetes bacterium]|nr:hypothetical protein [Bacteroidota bacterium]MBS1629506.1 hypothetical protein [Bacteroidota bacterium]